IRIAGGGHKIIGNQFLKNRNQTPISFMIGGEYYPKVNNILIVRNTFNLTKFLLKCVRFPNHNEVPTNIELRNNVLHDTIKLKNKTIKSLDFHNSIKSYSRGKISYYYLDY